MLSRLFSICLSSVLFLTTLFWGTVSLAASNDLTFYEENGCTQDIVYTYSSSQSADDNCKEEGPCKGDNDEARSLKIASGAEVGATIQVFDDPSAKTDDDYSTITIKSAVPSEGICVSTFEDSRTYDSAVQVDYTEKNGLDGKVSHVTVSP
ncbi:MAG: hypothetical protein QNJ63_22555 [Calothrix sp. MO_192.B10]|nr:hypothetical protein [Calothrix sp. MO_192.B10]